MSTLILYKNVVALNREEHKSLRINAVGNLNFSADATLVPIVAAEFVEIARQSPIAFFPAQDGALLPVTLLGLPEGKNLYLDESGKWDAPYIPAFIRRYPFIFAETGEDQLTLCIDRDFSGFSETAGAPLFEESGEDSPVIKNALDMLAEFQRQNVFTNAFMKRLVDSGILMESKASAQLNDGRNLEINGLLIVDENKFKALPEDTVKEWFTSGELGLIYAHLISLGNFLELLRRQTAPAAASVTKAKKK